MIVLLDNVYRSWNMHSQMVKQKPLFLECLNIWEREKEGVV